MKNSPINFLLTLFVSSFIVLGCSNDDEQPTTNPEEEQQEELEEEEEEEEEQEQEESTIEITVEDFSGVIDENEESATSLGTVTATTNEGNLAFSITSQIPEDAVAINSETGELTIANANAFDYETNTSITGVIKAMVGTTSETLDFTITINDVQDAELEITSSNTFSVEENSANGTIIGTITAITDSSLEVSYTLETVSLSEAITIDASTGVITVVNADKIDFETVQNITATVKVTLGDLNDTQDITISIIDIVEPISVTTFAGSTEGYVDGDISVATFDRPTGMAMDNQGNIYVTEYGNHTVRKITPEGMVSTLAGGFNGYQDGTGTAARLFRPSDIIMGNDGYLYVADTWNNRIRKISLSGEVTTVAGSTGGYAEGTGTNAKFDKPSGLSMDSNGNIYVADLENQRIRKIDPNGLVSTLAGGTNGYDDGTGSAAQFKDPTGIAITSNNELLVTDYYGRTVRKVTLNGVVTTWAGSGISGSFDRTRLNSSFGTPNGIAIDIQGDVLVSCATHDNIRKISITADEVTTVAGMSNTSAGQSGDIDGIASEARFYEPAGMLVAPDGTIYVADYENHKIRVIK
ncbi:hypothetical protein GH721_02965 [Kriegella sp. EG-1]|nr:hypothetical protein [Flavobacteriaceae bacterium EG-1]